MVKYPKSINVSKNVINNDWIPKIFEFEHDGLINDAIKIMIMIQNKMINNIIAINDIYWVINWEFSFVAMVYWLWFKV